MSNSVQRACIDACNACAAACDHCAASCLREDDVKAMSRCIANDIDCAAICRTAAGYIARDSASAGALCELCARICDQCADECSQHSMDHCQACAKACRDCAAECRKMAV